MATEIIWHVFGGDTGKVAPIVDWYEGRKLDCADGQAFWTTVYAVQDYRHLKTCVKGMYITSMHLALIAYQAGQAMSETSLAHELCHAYFRDSAEHEICRDDGSHDDPVTRANEQLRKIGL